MLISSTFVDYCREIIQSITPIGTSNTIPITVNNVRCDKSLYENYLFGLNYSFDLRWKGFFYERINGQCPYGWRSGPTNCRLSRFEASTRRYLLISPNVLTSNSRYFYLKNRNNDKYLDLTLSRLQSGTNIQSYECNNSTAQKWRFSSDARIYSKGGYYRSIQDVLYSSESQTSS